MHIFVPRCCFLDADELTDTTALDYLNVPYHVEVLVDEVGKQAEEIVEF